MDEAEAFCGGPALFMVTGHAVTRWEVLQAFADDGGR